MSATAAPARRLEPVTLAAPAARAVSLLLLVAFGALHWMAMLEPTATARAWYAVLAAGVAVGGLLGAGRLAPRLRPVAAAAVALVALVLALLAGGVADELIRPDGWGELLSGIDRGITALPGVRVPYRGVDEWTRIVIGAGGTTLAVVAAIIAFWPRSTTLGFRHVALILLVTLYVVPAVALDFEGEFLRGAALAVLVLAYLRLETIGVSDAGAAGVLAIGVAVLGLIAAPALDKDTPWWDYEAWALNTASAKSERFSWDHTYGVLDWPRDGRELLRVKARRAAYWKAMNLDSFNGRRWVHGVGANNTDACGLETTDVTRDPTSQPWLQNIKVTVRNLNTSTFITAGVACAIKAPRFPGVSLGDGVYGTVGRALRRGDAYNALVYTPSPTERQRRAAGTAYPQYLSRYTTMTLPADGASFGQERRAVNVQFAAFGTGGPAFEQPAQDPAAEPKIAGKALTSGPYARTYALARQLMRGARTPEDYVGRVERYLGRGFTYTESPPAEAENLQGFLLDAKAGYCQQFSGAMAMLLRMGGVPARVSTGFTTGALDRRTGEYVVRDLDAHSWVEVWYPSYGWVTFDPTPASAPARSQPDDSTASGLTGASPRAPNFGGDIRSDPSRRREVAEPGTPWTEIGFGVAAVLALVAVMVWVVVRHRRRVAAGWGPLDDLQLALRRAGWKPRPGTTLQTLEAALGAAPGAAGFVRAVREARYSPRAAAPTAQQRRALRAELGRGRGVAGRLRAWWALPPRPR